MTTEKQEQSNSPTNLHIRVVRSPESVLYPAS